MIYRAISFLLLAGLVLLKSCASSPGDVADVPAPKLLSPRYVRRANYDTVIVFVHGVFGDAESTWTNPKSLAYWPDLINQDRNDQFFRETDIYVFAYSSPFLKESYRIDDVVELMRMVFERDEVFRSHKQVVFVCHSMGGLVVRGFLKRYQSYAAQVPFIYFYSTPTAGSHITQLARLLTKNPQIAGMLPSDTNEYLDGMQKDFRAMSIHVPSYCAYEMKDTFGIRIVDQQSATALCDGPVAGLMLNHIQIVKPENREDLIYSIFEQKFATRSVLSNNISVKNESMKSDQKVDVGCGKTKEDTIRIAIPRDLAEGEKVVDAVVALRQGNNLKEEDVESLGVSQSSAKIHYKVTGLDPDSAGRCLQEGTGMLEVTFEIIRSIETVRNAQAQ